MINVSKKPGSVPQCTGRNPDATERPPKRTTTRHRHTHLSEAVQSEDGIIEVERTGQNEETQTHAELRYSTDADSNASDCADGRHNCGHPNNQHLSLHLDSNGRV